MSSQFKWPEEAVARLKHLWCVEKRTSAEIAKAINAEFGPALSRSAILGKIHHLGLSGQGSPKNVKGDRKVTGAPSPPRLLNSRATAAPVPPAASPPAMRPVPLPTPAIIPPAEGLPLTTLSSTMCRFAVTPHMAKHHLFYGHQTVSGKDWCREHLAIVYEPATKLVRYGRRFA